MPTRLLGNESENYAICERAVRAVITREVPDSSDHLSESAKSLPIIGRRTRSEIKTKRRRKVGRKPMRRNPAVAITSIWRERSVVNVLQKVKNHRALLVFAIAILIVELATALLIAPAFAADLPSGVGSLDDYMHQSGDGPATAPSSPAYSPPSYSPQYAPPRAYAPEPSLAEEWNNSDPNTRRNLLIGAAVVGAVALGLWAYQHHEQYQARHARRRFYGRRPAY